MAKGNKGRQRAPRRPQRQPTNKNDLAIERAHLRHRIQALDRYVSLARTFLRGLVALGCMGLAYLSIKSLAGKDTHAFISAILRAKADEWVFGVVACVTSAGYAVGQSRQKKLLKRFGPYIKELEARIDPKRSTSHLTDTGDPTKEDRDDA